MVLDPVSTAYTAVTNINIVLGPFCPKIFRTCLSNMNSKNIDIPNLDPVYLLGGMVIEISITFMLVLVFHYFISLKCDI